jgi:hypothetical protein
LQGAVAAAGDATDVGDAGAGCGAGVPHASRITGSVSAMNLLFAINRGGE